MLLIEGGLGGGCVGELLDEGGLAGLWLVGEGFTVFGEVLGFLGAQFLEFGSQALLVLQLLLFGTGRVCLLGRQQGSGWIVEIVVEAYESVLLYGINQLIRESDRVLSARRLISIGCDFAIASRGRGDIWPLARLERTHGEKTCWVTSDEGFEFSAPIVGVGDPHCDCLRDDVELGEVGVEALAEQDALRANAATIGRHVETLQSYSDVASARNAITLDT